MNQNENADYGRMLMEHIRMSGVSDVVAALFMAGFATGCAVAECTEAPPIDEVLSVALDLLKKPPTFVNPPPKQN